MGTRDRQAWELFCWAKGLAPAWGSLLFPIPVLPARQWQWRWSSPGGDAWSLGCSPQADPRGCYSNMFHRPGAFGGEQLSCTNSVVKSQCRPRPCPVAHLPHPPQGLQKPRALQSPLPATYLACKDEPGAFRLSALLVPSREEVRQDLSGDSRTHQPEGPTLPLESPPGRRLRPPGGDHTGINKHLAALSSLTHMLFKIKNMNLDKARESIYKNSKKHWRLGVASLLYEGVFFCINTTINNKCFN